MSIEKTYLGGKEGRLRKSWGGSKRGLRSLIVKGEKSPRTFTGISFIIKSEEERRMT